MQQQAAAKRVIFHTVCHAVDALWPTSLNSTVLGAGEIQIQACSPVGRNGSGPADCTRGPEHPIGTAALVALLATHPRPQAQARAAAAAGAESPRCFRRGSAGNSQAGASPASSPLSPPPSTAFFIHSLPMQHFTRNLTDLTSHGEKVLSSRKTTKPAIQIFVHQQSPLTLPDSPRPPASQEP